MTISLRAHYEWYWNQESCFSSHTPTPESCFWHCGSCGNCLITLRTRSFSRACSDWFSTYIYTGEYCPSFYVNYLKSTILSIHPLNRHFLHNSSYKETNFFNCLEDYRLREGNKKYSSISIEIYQSRLNVSKSENSVTLRQHEVTFTRLFFYVKLLYSNIDSNELGQDLFDQLQTRGVWN